MIFDSICESLNVTNKSSMVKDVQERLCSRLSKSYIRILGAKIHFDIQFYTNCCLNFFPNNKYTIQISRQNFLNQLGWRIRKDNLQEFIALFKWFQMFANWYFLKTKTNMFCFGFCTFHKISNKKGWF